ncbi:uncharacterized protein LACBIDRAFT_327881 [Laccaria bicolor S238N-H82]|uniref:Predicted protein n=1 Tax=Laccaria bicolor (strain S238N-H82 / ATCC MYA-4686) TaxID=486041 RepID=B0DD38_LACBS|nr:uncharacterized protein LACBIDRAFT_327881 [Laccaria bicolor S238N-H82]EDR07405.1 predicted protein [Laccaria bicolor S238N-H82]|eukprot:XP_001881797.1 predicted protein [Laccaria bicolor S238N-H82]
MLSYHTRKVIAHQAKKAAKGMQEEEGGDTDNDEADILLYLFCLEIHQKSIRSPSEVHQKSIRSPAEIQWTENLAIMMVSASVHWKSDRSPAEVQWTQNSGQSNHFLLLSSLSGLSLDFAWTSSGIQSCPTDSDGLPTDCPLGPSEMAGSDESLSESIGQAVGVLSSLLHWPVLGSIVMPTPWQKRMIGMYMYASGAQRQAISVLSTLGLSESYGNLISKNVRRVQMVKGRKQKMKVKGKEKGVDSEGPKIPTGTLYQLSESMRQDT